MPKNLLLYRLIVINLLFCAGTAAAWQQGWVLALWKADSTPVTALIGGLFLFGMASMAWQAWKVSRLTDVLNENTGYAFDLRRADAFRPSLLEHLEHLRSIAEWLGVLGFAGTVIGFWIALSGVNADTISTGSGIQQAVAHLLSGMSVAFGTTIAGTATGLWLEVNYRIVKTASALLVAR